MLKHVCFVVNAQTPSRTAQITPHAMVTPRVCRAVRMSRIRVSISAATVFILWIGVLMLGRWAVPARRGNIFAKITMLRIDHWVDFAALTNVLVGLHFDRLVIHQRGLRWV